MIKNFETIIGIEIHLELNTKTKMFSAIKNDFNAKPNTLISPIDLGYPGTLPTINKEAVIKAIKLAKALNMKIDDQLHFDRKNYYYPDLPKGYQITQQFRPIGKDGFVEIELNNQEKKKIRIERIHLEEDTARQLHTNEGTLINYNRAGVPLIEIVSMADIRTKEEAAKYVDEIRKIATFLDISDAIMAEGSLRADINISTRLVGDKNFGTKVEIKNLNSINNIRKAIEFEANEQIKQIFNSSTIKQTTKRFDETKNETIIMREKNDSIDYRYFPEPNIPIIQLEKSFIDSVEIGELPSQMKERYLSLNVANEFIDQLINNIEYAQYIDKINLDKKDEIVKIFFSELVPLSIKNNVSINKLGIKVDDFQRLIEILRSGEISGKQLKMLMPKLIDLNISVDQLIEKENIKLISDPKIINDWLDEIKNNNPNLMIDYKEREDRTIKFIIGEIMKMSKGQVNPILTVELIKKKMGV